MFVCFDRLKGFLHELGIQQWHGAAERGLPQVRSVPEGARAFAEAEGWPIEFLHVLPHHAVEEGFAWELVQGHALSIWAAKGRCAVVRNMRVPGAQAQQNKKATRNLDRITYFLMFQQRAEAH